MDSNRKAHRREIFASFGVARLEKSALVCGSCHPNPSKIYSTVGALQFISCKYLGEMRQKLEAICGYCKNFCRNIGKYLPIETLSVRARLGYPNRRGRTSVLPPFYAKCLTKVKLYGIMHAISFEERRTSATIMEGDSTTRSSEKPPLYTLKIVRHSLRFRE